MQKKPFRRSNYRKTDDRTTKEDKIRKINLIFQKQMVTQCMKTSAESCSNKLIKKLKLHQSMRPKNQVIL